MIDHLNIKDPQIAQSVLAIQIPAYQIEADLIGFQGIPALADTAETLQNSRETFLGFYEGTDLLGVLSYEETEDAVDICRLVVAPASFRKGVGRQLVEFTLDKYKQTKDITVSTGEQNAPALNLYKKLGFTEQRSFDPAPGVTIVSLLRTQSS